MKKVAYVTLDNGETEEVRGFARVEFTPLHIVFYMTDKPESNVVVYKADRVSEFFTENFS